MNEPDAKITAEVKPLTLDEFVGKSTSELEAELWPYAREQYDKSLLFLGRLRQWKSIVTELRVFFDIYRESQAVVAKEGARIVKLFNPDTPVDKNQEHAHPHIDALPVVKTVHANIGAVVKSLDLSLKSIDTDLVKLLHDIDADYQRNSKAFSQKLEKMFGVLRTERTAVLKLFEAHFASVTKIKQHKSNDSSIVDPWLSEKAISEQLKVAVEKENEGRKSLVILHTQIQDYEKQLVTSLMKIIPTFLMITDASWKRNHDSLAAFDAYLKTLNAQQAFQYFTTELGLSSADCFHKEQKMEDMPYKLDEKAYLKEIKKQDVLERPGAIRKSVFKTALFVITANGFMHCFNLKDSKQDPKEVLGGMEKLQYSVNLRTPKLTLTKSLLNVNCFEVNVPVHPKPLFGASHKKYLVKCKNEKQRDDWVEEMATHLLMNRDRPTVMEE